MEMVAGNYVLAMTSIMDTMQGYNRLVQALTEIDKDLHIVNNNYSDPNEMYFNNPTKVRYTIAQCSQFNTTSIDIEQSEGKISAEYIYLYPPGVPIIVPGEVIDKELIKQIKLYKRSGLILEGLHDNTNKVIKIIEN